ncbi:MAG TPA: RHS repeat-associated core domain-containing protein [Bacillota bacterium]|nr:RHS repeat-associated core domain-containing protein [Bacillota bacterium]
MSSLIGPLKYPEAANWLNYNYNSLNQLSEVAGFTTGISYEADGALKGLTYANGVNTSYTYDANRRLSNLNAAVNGSGLLDLTYTYDAANNIINIKDIQDKNKIYEYDANNQLIKAITPGQYPETKPTSGRLGSKNKDYEGTSWLSFSGGIIKLDYYSSSIGVDFGTIAPGVKKILLVPGAGQENHRVTAESLDLFVGDANQSYSLIPRNDWVYEKDSAGVITITFTQAKAMRYLKIHVWFNDLGDDAGLHDHATFINELANMLQVYQEASSQTEEYKYDPVGNRTLQKITLVQSSSYTSYYYANSDRLKTDGKFAFKYDNAGNLTEKGNVFSISGDNVTFTQTSGDGVEYWHYTYDLLNRLTKVEKNGTLIAEYGYDPEGLRVVKKAHGETVHYVFEGTEPIYEKNVTTGKIHSYVYALGKHLARVDGEMDTYDNLRTRVVPVYFYTTDHLGSIKVVTDRNGTTVFQADHTAFGERYGESKTDPNFDEWHSFTGKEFDPDTGLYYFNARWYDADTGRFISEDPLADPNNPNLYCYGRNNPLTITDPTGLISQEEAMQLNKLFTTTENYTPPPQYVQNVINSNVEAHGFDNSVNYGLGLLAIQGTNNNQLTTRDNKKTSEVLKLEKETGIQYDTMFLSLFELEYKSWSKGSNLAVDNFLYNSERVNLALDVIGFALSMGLIGWDDLPKNAEVEFTKFNLGGKGSSKTYWGSWNDYQKVTVNGQKYAVVGGRLYSRHAVDRMQPSGNRYGGNSQVHQAGGDYGRSVSPTYVESTIQQVKPVVQENGNLSYTHGSLQVITNPQGYVVTIITK